ncbi:IS200/IS605 family element transposase accessory protein TnpB [Candidatus Micrarchaeota archaeon]|nr:IS200/IS605 family element transposase accessory protein TnpB [Candidatus Micrarchaeota archaeon]
MNIIRSYKFRLYPNRTQAKGMQTHLWLSKNLWNDGLELAKQLYTNYQKFPTRSTYQEISKNSGLHSQVAQNVFIRLDLALKAKIRRKKAGLKGGFPRFKSIDRVKSLHYPQSGFCLKTDERKLKVSPFGEINIKKHRELEGTIKTLTLKREASDKWYAILTTEAEAKPVLKNNGSQIGMDLGLMNFAVLSDATIIKNPRHLKRHQDNIRAKQKPLSRAKLGSSNRKKAKKSLAIVHEKVRNIRRDFLHKLSRRLVHSHSLIALEDLASQEMAEKNYGKSINDAGWNEFISMLSYKAESAGSRVILVNPENTTKECSRCSIMTDKELSERQHNCPSCGLSMDRDLNAAINILNRATLRTVPRSQDSREQKLTATAGIAGSNACEDEAIVSSVKQEAHAFRRG